MLVDAVNFLSSPLQMFVPFILGTAKLKKGGGKR